MIVTLLVSTGAAWEARALHLLSTDPGTVVLKRCVDVDDLLAAASTGQAEAAVLGAELPGLDAPVVEELGRYGVRIVAVAADPEAASVGASRIGVTTVVAADGLDDLPDVVGGDGTTRGPTVIPEEPELPPEPSHPQRAGRVIAVHGAGGGPGRTTVAVNLAAELAARGQPTLLVDADPHGGAVAQHLGILDEVSGLLSAARLFTAGTLHERLPTVQRSLAEPLHVLTGLPRPDRWTEVRPGTLDEIVEHARDRGHVVIDTGFSIEQTSLGEPGARPERNGLTVEALESADEALLVGAADPVGLARLVRTLLEVRDAIPGTRLRVVVNRMRQSLGWREVDVRAMLEGFGSGHTIDLLPEDQATVDRALVDGRSLAEIGEGPLRRALADLADALVGPSTR